MRSNLIMIKYYLIIVLSALCYIVNAQQNYSFKNGDIFFQDISCGPFCDAVNKVTYSCKDADFAHVGVLISDNNKWFVAEAVSKGVILTQVDTFLNRALDKNKKPKVMVGRLKNNNSVVMPTIASIKPFINKQYDDIFDISNDKYYCSELIYELFKDIKGNRIFSLAPMTFKDPDTKQLFPIWKTYFDSLKVEVPEGKPGLNPGSISRSELLEIYTPYSKFKE
ncbi:MAG: hypothetical protein HY951_15610 [Bacteroidia bacterium]|nr:hypothetical protein [Bacteroidia bacterium]